MKKAKLARAAHRKMKGKEIVDNALSANDLRNQVKGKQHEKKAETNKYLEKVTQLEQRARLAETLEGVSYTKKAEIMENKYLTKLAEKKDDRPGYGSALATNFKSMGRGTLEGLLGGAAGTIVGGLAGKAFKNQELGAMAGVIVGNLAGMTHGSLTSTKNSLNKAYDKGQKKEASLGGMLTTAVRGVSKFGRDVTGSRVASLTSKVDAGPVLPSVTNKLAKATTDMKNARRTAKLVGGGVAAGAVGASMMSGGQNKQAEENKYLQKIAGSQSRYNQKSFG
jgi:hypothetical protein